MNDDVLPRETGVIAVSGCQLTARLWYFPQLAYAFIEIRPLVTKSRFDSHHSEVIHHD
jgi:hypothetical protein